MPVERPHTNITLGEVITSAEFIHRNQEAKTWLIRAISAATSVLVFALTSWIKGHLPWLESEVPFIIRLAHALAGGSFIFTMLEVSFFFFSRLKAAKVLDARKRQLPDHIKIAKEDNGTFWIINRISGQCLPVRSDNNYNNLVQDLMSSPIINR